MAKIPIPTREAFAVRRRLGSTVLIVNQGTQDVWFNRDANELNASVEGSTAIKGTKLAAPAGGNPGDQYQWQDYPGEVWFRAAVAGAEIDIQP